jgi:hypothetical protein
VNGFLLNRCLTRERLAVGRAPVKVERSARAVPSPRDGARENTLTGWPKARQSPRVKRFGQIVLRAMNFGLQRRQVIHLSTVIPLNSCL